MSVKFPRRAANGGEQGAYTGWRKVLVYMSRPGVVKGIKRQTHKRERREGKNYIRDEVQHDSR